MSDNAPALRDEFPLPPELKNANLTFLDVQLMNIKWDYYIFSRIADAWRQASSIAEIGMCQHITNTQIEKHRNHLGFPNAYEASSKKESLVYPID